MNLKKSHAKLLATAFLASGLAVACGDDPADTPEDDVHEIVLVDRDDDEQFADYHEDHWHGLIELETSDDQDDYKSVGFGFYDHDGDPVDIPLGDDGYDYDVDVDDADLVWVDEHSDHFHIGGNEHDGETALYLDFTRDGEVFFDTRQQGLSVFVDDHDDNGHDHDDLHVEEFELLDREDGEAVVADVHDDHWDGDFADGIELDIAEDTDNYETAPVGDGEAVSLGANVEEEHGDHTHSVDLDGDPYELEVAPAHDGDDDYVDLHNHGDHVHVIGTDEGHAHVVFQIVDRPDDEVVWESPEFEFDVHE